MATKLTLTQVNRLAFLAKLELTENEAVRYQKELSDVLDYFKMLEKIDTTGLKPTSQVTGLQNVMRADRVESQITTPEDLIALSPDSHDGYIKVKRMI